MARFPVQGLANVEFVVPDLSAACDFYSSAWGLSMADRTDKAAWLRGTGSDPYLLSLREGPVTGISAMTFRIAPEADVDDLRSRMVAQGCLGFGGNPAEAPGGGMIESFRDPVGRTLRLLQGDLAADPLPFDPDRPERLAHVNINSDDVSRDQRLFTEGLGFSLTDRSKMMAFVRTNDDHHSVVIADAKVNGLNHVAFQLPTWEGVMRASGRMVDAGFPLGWGPGRHGPGNNVFAYFVDPFGFVVEHTAEVLQVDDGYRVGTPDDWTWPSGRTDHWGIAPPKTDACKAAQNAIPFL